MIGISAIEATGDHVVIYENLDSDLSTMTARVTRSQTLDGGAVITHSGVSHGDRTLRIRAKLDEADAATLTAIHEDETLLYLSAPDGFFSGAIESLKIDGGDLTLSFLIKEKLSE